MSDAVNTLLAMDLLAQLTRAGLNPKLHAALENKGRFASKSAGPAQSLSTNVGAGNLPDGVVLFPNGHVDQRRDG
jgi:hypothetical protein